MSIRLRLTLLYSAVLAVTLIAFGILLYLTQAQLTFDGLKSSLARQADDFITRERRFTRRTDPASPVLTLTGRWTQTRNADGTITGRTPDLGDTPLPISKTGLSTVQNGEDWSESAVVQNEPLLIYSAPVFTQEKVTQIVQIASPTTERDQALGTLRLILVVGGGLAILLAFGMGWVLAGMALVPIHQITGTAQTIGAEKDFSRRVEYKGPPDEVGQLATTFNTMLTELESAYRQLEDALQAQRRFVADASHELRTPLTTVRGNIALLQDKRPVAESDRAEALADTKDEVDRLIRLVNQLLALARADTKPTLQPEVLSVKPLLEDVCRQTKLRTPKRDITCEVGEDVTVLANPDALKQVLLILCDNAVTHTPNNASVCMTSEVVDGHVMISVEDTGPGIPPPLLPHIFERFFRGDPSRSGPGAGLGLSIAQELVQAQNGTIKVESQVNKGSTFTVTLPRAEA